MTYTLVGGHLTKLGTRNDVIIQKEFVSDLEKAAGRANQEVLFSKVASQVGRFDNPWLIFYSTINGSIDGSIMFTCCLTCDCYSGKYLWIRSYILSNTHTWFSG